ncbi:hypothetical protein HII12_004398 [Brettanomyces bruxellensis]|uniref:DEBR0S3_09054g1_1 n=1 Tax=Dekkera bruxellensis TaxID=5007 RepID=A0A7D9CXW4_DEKBR|nr:hypothetical protein HII12_004398 [Brettanomyces bruxellensis]VUG18374.1 DEBR0S3_09054g1_1 [Brettanomyces bruxellensis]
MLKIGYREMFTGLRIPLKNELLLHRSFHTLPVTFYANQQIRTNKRPPRINQEATVSSTKVSGGNSSSNKESIDVNRGIETRDIKVGGNPHNESKKRIGWFKKVLILTGGTLFTAYAYDNLFGDGISNRVIRSLSTFLLISVDYKLNFKSSKDVAALHERNANRVYNLIINNKGMYIKMGQMMAIQGFMFPKQYQDKFKLMFDQAPEESWETCDNTLKNELGQDYRDEIFSSIDETPIASASIAQVHKGILKRDGQQVAVKIQKSTVTKQVDADLLTYRLAMRLYQWIFGMPLMTTAKYVCKKSREELDFEHELQNADRITKLIDSDPEFKDNVYIPKYYPEYSTKKVLIGEWIDGDSIGKYKKLADDGYDIQKLMNSIIRVYSRQIFSWGVVHCDLHPGNLLVRMIPSPRGDKKKIQQLVILDHGLYEIFDDKFKRQYSEFWKYTMERNQEKVINVLKSWGINPDDMMMTAIGMKDTNSEAFKKKMEEIHHMSYYDKQVMLKKGMQNFFDNTDIFPMCLVFVMRSMRIVQGLNRNFGSPCNRMGILVTEANKTVDLFEQISKPSFRSYAKKLERNILVFIIRLATFFTFEINKLIRFIVGWLPASRVKQIADLEEKYEKDLMQAGHSMGFESIPSTQDLLEQE